MIKEIREKLEMSQCEFGVLLGKTQGSISHYELGRRPIDSDFAKSVIELCHNRGLSVDYNYIYGYQQPMVGNG